MILGATGAKLENVMQFICIVYKIGNFITKSIKIQVNKLIFNETTSFLIVYINPVCTLVIQQIV